MSYRAKVIALDFTFGDYPELLQELLPEDIELVFAETTEPQLYETLTDADILLVAWTQLTRGVIQAARNVRLIQTTSVGVNHIDLDAAREYDIPVANDIGTNAVATAEHTLLLILAVYRRLIEAFSAVRQAKWPQADLYQAGLYELHGKTVGLVGFGNIGQTVAKLLLGFDVRILYYRRHRLSVAEETALNASHASLDTLLQASDVVSLHVPLTQETEGLIGKHELGLMKSSSILINTSRGAVVNESVLIEALETRQIAGAGLDVLTQEPIKETHPLRREGLNNVVLTPHVGGATAEAARRAVASACQNIVRVAHGKAPINVIAE